MFGSSCSKCEFLDTKKKQPGRSGGNLYYCKKNKVFINPYDNKPCEAYEKDWGRKSSTVSEIDDDAKKYDNRDDNISKPLLLLAFIIIIGILALIINALR